jgi:hypothetical protein
MYKAWFLTIFLSIQPLCLRCEETCTDKHKDLLQLYALSSNASECIRQNNYLRSQHFLRCANAINLDFKSTASRGSSFHKKEGLGIEYGEWQVERMLKDLPVLKQHLKKGDLLWQWASHRFSGADGYGPMKWMSEPPDNNADQISPTQFQPGTIRVKRSDIEQLPEAMKSDRLWSRIIYELHISCYGSYYEDSVNLARTGDITKEEFVRRVFLMEMAAIDDTRDFYANVYLVWAEDAKAKTDSRHWYLNAWWGDKNALFDSRSSQDVYPWEPYGSYYDLFERARLRLRLEK